VGIPPPGRVTVIGDGLAVVDMTFDRGPFQFADFETNLTVNGDVLQLTGAELIQWDFRDGAGAVPAIWESRWRRVNQRRSQSYAGSTCPVGWQACAIYSGTWKSHSEKEPLPMDTTASHTIAGPYDVGDVVEDFALPTLDGGEGRLTDYDGKVVLLVFTATWCPYCGAEAPFLEQEIWQRFKDRDFQLVVVDIKESAELMRPFRERYGWTCPVWSDEQGHLALRFAPQKEGLPPEVAVINAHFILDGARRVLYRDYLNMERFDARAAPVVAELERVLGP
jgi:peroxiredoxin